MTPAIQEGMIPSHVNLKSMTSTPCAGSPCVLSCPLWILPSAGSWRSWLLYLLWRHHDDRATHNIATASVLLETLVRPGRPLFTEDLDQSRSPGLIIEFFGTCHKSISVIMSEITKIATDVWYHQRTSRSPIAAGGKNFNAGSTHRTVTRRGQESGLFIDGFHQRAIQYSTQATDADEWPGTPNSIIESGPICNSGRSSEEADHRWKKPSSEHRRVPKNTSQELRRQWPGLESSEQNGTNTNPPNRWI